MTNPAPYRPLAMGSVVGAGNTTQATEVERARAIAEVQAAVVVAQQVPRDQERALAEMRDSCKLMSLAERAFYTVPSRGTNQPSVHLMRELARIWGNVQYGVHELRRDDAKGESEVLAFAWDVQANTRTSRVFQQPHARMAGGQRVKLTDLGDIYLSNQNTGARAVRECIGNVLPRWFVEEAQTICRNTLEHGEGVPLHERRQNMVNAYREIGIKLDQIEAKLGRKFGQWNASDIAQMGILYTSITRDGLDKDEEFPPARITAADIKKDRETDPPAAEPAAAGPDEGSEATAADTGQRPEPEVTETPDLAEAAEPSSAAPLDQLVALLRERGKTTRPAQSEYLSARFERKITDLRKLSDTEVASMLDHLLNGPVEENE